MDKLVLLSEIPLKVNINMHISQLLRSVYHIVDKPHFNPDYLSEGQLSSKCWLVDELLRLNLDLGTVFICAGWYGSLATLLFESGIKLDKIRSFDRDSECAWMADTINRPWVIDGWKFKASTLDIMTMTYPTTYTTTRWNGTTLELTEMPNTIINTSCEHIDDFDGWFDGIPSGKLVVLQNNNYHEISDHVNCVDSLADFDLQSPLTSVLFEGELSLPEYTRYMRIGIK